VCAIVGGIFTVSGIIDRMVYTGTEALARKNRRIGQGSAAERANTLESNVIFKIFLGVWVVAICCTIYSYMDREPKLSYN
jgi:hypothetical protein